MQQRYKKIAITGPNSFLGTNVVLQLDARNVSMRLLLRHTNKTIDALSTCEIVYGDVLNFDDLCSACQGCDAIIHIAAITDQSLLNFEQYRRFNVGALENVIAVARHTGIKRIVFVSSANAIGNGTPTKFGDETTPVNGSYRNHLYSRSKIEAERVLRAATDLESVIVNPCFMLGAYDSKPSSGEIIMMGYDKRIIFAAPGGKNIINVEAAAIATVNAVECGRAGENYLLAGQNISMSDFFRLLSIRTPKRSLIITVPKPILMIGGYVGDLLRFFGIKTRISSINIGVVCTREYYDGAKAKRELGLPQSSVGESIDSAVGWFAANGMLKKKK